MRLLLFAILGVLFASGPASADNSPDRMFHPRPDHAWNRLRAAVWLRKAADGKSFGRDRIDPLLWQHSRHLTEGESARGALAALDAFLAIKKPGVEQETLKRALLQHEMWAVFDWLANRSATLDDEKPRDAAAGLIRKRLLEKLAKAMHRLALDSRQIATLPDNYAAAVASKRFATAFDPAHPGRPFLPPRLFEKNGPWVRLGTADGPLAPGHLRGHAGFTRSVFSVFLRLPGGRKNTVDYLKTLWSYKRPWTFEPNSRGGFALIHNPKTPQFPAGTQAALVRQMLLIDARGRLTASPITQSVQLRVYRRIAAMKEQTREPDRDPAQRFVEFELRPSGLLAHKAGGLHPLKADETDFLTGPFAGEADPFEEQAESPRTERRPLSRHLVVPSQRCATCHREPGVLSFNSYTRSFGPPTTRPPAFFDDNTPARSIFMAIRAKQRRYDWGLLTGLLSRHAVRE